MKNNYFTNQLILDELSLNDNTFLKELVNTPEWIKFIAAFFDKIEEANKIFDEIAGEYNSVKASTIELLNKPTVFTGLAFKGEWTIPGGNSFAANYLKDAGGRLFMVG